MIAAHQPTSVPPILTCDAEGRRGGRRREPHPKIDNATSAAATAEKKRAAKKFKEDVARALHEKANLKVFVAFTNVSLTVGEKQVLIDHAKALGLQEIANVYRPVKDIAEEGCTAE